jgi:peroxiredoxin
MRKRRKLFAIMGTGILKAGDKAIDFTLPSARTNQTITLSDFEGRENVVLIFYRGLF